MCENNINNKKDDTNEIKIGNTTYTIISHYDDRAKDTIIDKIERLILRDAQNKN